MSLKKRNKYIKAMNSYGVYPMLVLLDEYEQEENYQECQIIYEAIVEKEYWLKDANKTIEEGLDLPTHISQMQLPKFKHLWDSISDGGIINNTKYYVKEIKKLTANVV